MLFQLHPDPAKIILLGLIVLVFIAIGSPAVANAQSLLDPVVVPTPGTLSAPTTISQAELVAFAPATPAVFTSTTNPLIQRQELAAYVQSNALPARVVQVDLTALSKISQYTDIDSSANGYGANACGLVAAAAAMGGSNWVPLVDTLAQAAGSDYNGQTGIQPSHYFAALQKVFGAQTVSVQNASTLGTLYQELSAGKIVIVDIRVNANTESPSISTPNYAHFARVLGIDLTKGTVYIENTLSGPAYWTVSLNTFVQVWDHPETAVSLIPDSQTAEPITRWMVMLQNAPVAA